MNLLLRHVKIFDPSSPFHQYTADILVRDGIIQSIGTGIEQTADQVIDGNGLLASPGWVDLFAHFPDPGLEHKETIESGAAVAAAGGFTDVFLLPNTSPIVHNKSAVEYIVQRSKYLPVTLHPIGAVTKNAEGKELAEMYDMHQSGAVAFGDGNNTIQSAGMVLKALQYIKAIGKTLIQVADDKSISAHGLMNEGIVSTQLGLPGKPAIAEEAMISRDIELAKYTDSKIHFTGVSTARAMNLIRHAKAEGLNVSCSVTPYHLFYCDEDLRGYDTNLKVNPPLRTAFDRDELRRAVMDGTVDCIASHHAPHEKDSKVVEFEYAKDGMIGLQTSFSVVRSLLPELSVERLIELFATNARSLFGLTSGSIKEGEPACVSLFLWDEKWLFDERHNRSRSSNSPFFGNEFTGRVRGIINKDKVFLND
jgi:dihydroorotase